MVNNDSMTDGGWLPKSVWILLSYLGILLVWNRPTKEDGWVSKLPISSQHFGRYFDGGRRVVGGLILLMLAIAFRGNGDRALIEMDPQWWGIIGLIGWAYLVAANVYLVTRNRIGGLVGAMALLYCVNLADNQGRFPDFWIFQHVHLATALGSMPAVVVAGVIAGVVLSPESTIRQHGDRIRWGLMFGAGLAVAAWLLHGLSDLDSMFFINKINATSPWCLYSSAIAIGIWVLLYGVVDALGWKRWSIIAGPAGQNPLFAYILVPILYAALDLWELITGKDSFYWDLSDQFSTGCLRSLVLALLVSAMAGGLQRIGIQPKL